MTSPLQEFKRKHEARWAVLTDVPAWEASNIVGWVKLVMHDESGHYMGLLCRRIESDNRLLLREIGVSYSDWLTLKASLERQLALKEYDNFFAFIECLVILVRSMSPSVVIEFYGFSSQKQILMQLENSLLRGSKWTVVFNDGDAGLVERVDPKLTSVAKDLKISALTEAWNKAFALHPDPEKAVEFAQKAVELIASEMQLTAAKTSVFGNLIGDMRANPNGYETVAKDAFQLADELIKSAKNPEVDANGMFMQWMWMGLDLVQKTNPGRHASDVTKDFELSSEAAKQAVLIATLTCHLIKQGYIYKSKKERA